MSLQGLPEKNTSGIVPEFTITQSGVLKQRSTSFLGRLFQKILGKTGTRQAATADVLNRLTSGQFETLKESVQNASPEKVKAFLSHLGHLAASQVDLGEAKKIEGIFKSVVEFLQGKQKSQTSPSTKRKAIGPTVAREVEKIRERISRSLTVRETLANGLDFTAQWMKELDKERETVSKKAVDHTSPTLADTSVSTSAVKVKKTVSETLPTGDFSRFLNFLSVKVTDVNKKGESASIQHEPEQFPKLDEEANQLVKEADELEKSSQNDDLNPVSVLSLKVAAEELRISANNIRQHSTELKIEYVSTVLKALAADQEEQAKVEDMIKTLREDMQKGISLNNALDAVLSTNCSTLPRNLSYLLSAGGQGTSAPLMDAFLKMNPDPKTTLIPTADLQRKVKVELTKDAMGSISFLSIRQEMRFIFQDVAQSYQNGLPKPVLSVPITQKTDVTMESDGTRRVQSSVAAEAKPTVMVDDPINRDIAVMIEETLVGSDNNRGISRSAIL